MAKENINYKGNVIAKILYYRWFIKELVWDCR